MIETMLDLLAQIFDLDTWVPIVDKNPIVLLIWAPIWIGLTFTIFKRLIQWYFNLCWRFKKGSKKRMKQLPAGARIEVVAREAPEPTVGWEVPIHSLLLLTLGIQITLFWIGFDWAWQLFWSGQAKAMIQEGMFNLSPERWKIVLRMYVAVVMFGIPFIYHRRLWRNRNTGAVVTTKKTWWVEGKTPILGLFFGLVKDIFISETETMNIEELKIAADPEDLDPEFKTSPLRDAWTKFWFGREHEDFASMLLPARAFGGRDNFAFIQDAFRLAEAFPLIKQRAEQLAGIEGIYLSSAEGAWKEEYETSRSETRSDAMAARERQTEQARLAHISPGGPIDLFDALDKGDPGHYPQVELLPQVRGREPTRGIEFFEEGDWPEEELGDVGSGTPQPPFQPISSPSGLYAPVAPPVAEPEESGDFEEAWQGLYRKRRHLLDAGITKEIARALSGPPYYKTPDQLAQMVIQDGLTAEEILRDFPVEGYETEEVSEEETKPQKPSATFVPEPEEGEKPTDIGEAQARGRPVQLRRIPSGRRKRHSSFLPELGDEQEQ